MRFQALQTAALALALLASCGGADSPDPQKPATGPTSQPDAAPNQSAEPATKGPPPTEEQCREFLDHVVDLSREARNKSVENPEEQYSAEDAEKAREEFREKSMGLCLSRSKVEIECGLRAKTADDLTKC